MKRLISISLALVMVLSLSACKGSNPYKNITEEQIESKVDNGNLGELHCYYSVENSDRSDDEFFVHFPDDIYDSEKDSFYDEKGDTNVQFFGEKVFYDKKTGKTISEDELEYGQFLIVVYNGEVYGKNPVTIKAVKVYVA